ncbi:EamA family transporter [Halarchaeum sp. P4]|uniref:EamA family transporter n=1 Tax=Halarchaeum sp. P4 TaxID=3421639 RepID=UPI003EC0790C
MSLSASSVYALAVLAAVLWGASPVLIKHGLNRGADARQAVLVALAVDAAVVWTVLVAMNGVSVLDTLATVDPATLALFAVTGALGTGLGRFVGLVGLDRLGASVYSAAISVRPLFATALGVAALGEHLTPTSALGVAVLVCGLIVLERARSHGGGERGGWQRRDLALPLVAAATFAASRVLRRSGLQTADVSVLLAVATNELVGLLTLAVVLGATGGRSVFAPPRASLPPFLASGVCLAGGMVAVFSALAAPAGRVVVVDPLVATVPLFTLAFASAFLDTERVTRHVALGTVGVVVGAVLVVW